ncbi:MAG: hypothetical protein Q8M03_03000 [Legionella sp.]|nr:hypothetical protein [Legionella sp.]
MKNESREEANEHPEIKDIKNICTIEKGNKDTNKVCDKVNKKDAFNPSKKPKK